MKLRESQSFRTPAWGGAARTRRWGRCARDALPESAGGVSGTGGSGLSVNKGCRPLEASGRRGGRAGSWYWPPADPLPAPCPRRHPPRRPRCPPLRPRCPGSRETLLAEGARAGASAERAASALSLSPPCISSFAFVFSPLTGVGIVEKKVQPQDG